MSQKQSEENIIMTDVPEQRETKKAAKHTAKKADRGRQFGSPPKKGPYVRGVARWKRKNQPKSTPQQERRHQAAQNMRRSAFDSIQAYDAANFGRRRGRDLQEYEAKVQAAERKRIKQFNKKQKKAVEKQRQLDMFRAWRNRGIIGPGGHGVDARGNLFVRVWKPPKGHEPWKMRTITFNQWLKGEDEDLAREGWLNQKQQAEYRKKKYEEEVAAAENVYPEPTPAHLRVGAPDPREFFPAEYRDAVTAHQRDLQRVDDNLVAAFAPVGRTAQGQRRRSASPTGQINSLTGVERRPTTSPNSPKPKRKTKKKWGKGGRTQRKRATRRHARRHKRKRRGSRRRRRRKRRRTKRQ